MSSDFFPILKNDSKSNDTQNHNNLVSWCFEPSRNNTSNESNKNRENKKSSLKNCYFSASLLMKIFAV